MTSSLDDKIIQEARLLAAELADFRQETRVQLAEIVAACDRIQGHIVDVSHSLRAIHLKVH
jgi:hypothetical protein